MSAASPLSSSLSGRVALVTGGSRGIGRACCVHLARAGCAVAVNYHRSGSAAQETKKLILQESRDARVELFQCDVSDENAVRQMISSINDKLGVVSILVNNAGIGAIKQLDDLTVDDFDEMIRVNLRSAFLVTQSVYKGMENQKWGRLIFMTSIAAYVGGATGPHYSASKAGMIGLTQSYASRLAKSGITSNAVSPGLVESDMLQVMVDAIGKQTVLDRTNGGRLGQPDEVAAVVAMLAGNGYINGQVIGVDSGIYPK